MDASDGRVTLSSTHIDRHYDKVPLAELESIARQINQPDKQRILIDHRRDLPPIGYWDDAVVDLHEGEYLLRAKQIFYETSLATSAGAGLVSENLKHPTNYRSRNTEREKTILIIDKNNYKSLDIAKDLANSIMEESEGETVVNMETRKNLNLDAQISIILHHYYQILYPLLAPIAAKLGDKFLDEVIGDSYKSLKDQAKLKLHEIRNLITRTRKHSITNGKPQIVIFEIPGDPYIELFTNTSDIDLIIQALSPKKRGKMHSRVLALKKILPVKEAYFKLTSKGDWKFTYILLEDGTVIGTIEIMNKREKLLQRIKLGDHMGYSISGGVKYNDDTG